jgi:hypothetical protein
LESIDLQTLWGAVGDRDDVVVAAGAAEVDELTEDVAELVVGGSSAGRAAHGWRTKLS